MWHLGTYGMDLLGLKSGLVERTPRSCDMGQWVRSREEEVNSRLKQCNNQLCTAWSFGIGLDSLSSGRVCVVAEEHVLSFSFHISPRKLGLSHLKSIVPTEVDIQTQCLLKVVACSSRQLRSDFILSVSLSSGAFSLNYVFPFQLNKP